MVFIESGDDLNLKLDMILQEVEDHKYILQQKLDSATVDIKNELSTTVGELRHDISGLHKRIDELQAAILSCKEIGLKQQQQPVTSAMLPYQLAHNTSGQHHLVQNINSNVGGSQLTASLPTHTVGNGVQNVKGRGSAGDGSGGATAITMHHQQYFFTKQQPMSPGAINNAHQQMVAPSSNSMMHVDNQLQNAGTTRGASSGPTTVSPTSSLSREKNTTIPIPIINPQTMEMVSFEPQNKSIKIRAPIIKNYNIDEVSKKVRDALLVLKPDNFDATLKIMLTISLDTNEKIDQVASSIFEKTISEPNCVPTYAKLCIALIEHLKPMNELPFVSSIKKLIESEFRTILKNDDAINEERKSRACGTVRFIGEIYKLQRGSYALLSGKHVMRYMESLLQHVNEEKLEYLFELLTTSGLSLDSKTIGPGVRRVDRIFQRIRDVIERESDTDANNQSTISSLLRTKLQGVIDLRARRLVELQKTTVNLSPNDEIQPFYWLPPGTRGESIPKHNIDAFMKKVDDILHKLTTENFDVVLKKMETIPLDTKDKIHQVALLIFEQAISEPNLAPTYVKFFKVLLQEVKPESKQHFNTFLTKLLQKEFEKNVINDVDKVEKLKPLLEKLEACTDPMERLELQAEVADEEYQFRQRATGTVRFIGEMYKWASLTGDRVMLCIESLLEHGSEEKLEYMCKLLTNVGHLLSRKENNFTRIDRIFNRIKNIIKERNKKTKKEEDSTIQHDISRRVCFMMQDVVDLRGYIK